MRAISDTVKTAVKTTLATAWDTRDGTVVPTTESITLKDGAVKVEAAYLYADSRPVPLELARSSPPPATRHLMPRWRLGVRDRPTTPARGRRFIRGARLTGFEQNVRVTLLAAELQSTIDALNRTLADAWTADVQEEVARAIAGVSANR